MENFQDLIAESIARKKEEKAAEKAAEDAKLPKELELSLRSSVQYLTSRFLGDRHWARISESLTNKWDRFQSLNAALKLMEQNGVKLSQAEEDALLQMEEAQMIETLVMKMPQQSREQFHHFFTQLQLIVSTAGRVRVALEAGVPGLVEETLNDADSTGMAQYTLKLAVVQAGCETLILQKEHEAYVKDAEERMSRLVQGQQNARDANNRLGKARKELVELRMKQSERTKKVLMSFIGGSDSELLQEVFSSWLDCVKQTKLENQLYEEYRGRMEYAERRLVRAKLDKFKSLMSVIEKKLLGNGDSVLAEAFAAWAEHVTEITHDKVSALKLRELEAKIRSSSSRQAELAKKVMTRLGTESQTGLIYMCFHEWFFVLDEYKTSKMFEDKVKAVEKKNLDLLKERAADARDILTKIAGATNTGLLHSFFTAWFQYLLEERRSSELASVIINNNTKNTIFGEHGRTSAKRLLERAHREGITMLYLKTWGNWRLYVTVESLLREHTDKINGKRAQLMGVQQMFRSFAAQLQTNMASMEDDRDDPSDLSAQTFRRKYRQQQQLSKTEGASSLPDIHAQDARQGGAAHHSAAWHQSPAAAHQNAAARGAYQAPPRHLDRSWG